MKVKWFRTDYDYDFKALPEVYPPVIDLLISLLTAVPRIYKPVIDNVNHKMIESNLDFYLEEISESTRNTKRVKELRAIKNNQIFHVRQNSTQRFYQYRIDKIGQHKAYLRCVNYKCCSRLEVILGFNLKTEKIRNNFLFHEDVTEEMLKYRSISHCLKLSGARQIVYKKDYDEPCDSDAEYDSDPDSETEPDYDCYPDSE